MFSSLNGNTNINLYFCLETYKSKKQNYNLLLLNATYLRGPSLAFTNSKYKGFLIKIQVFIGFSAKLKVLKDFNKIKDF